LKDSGNRQSEDICLTCGLCCNGVIFGDVKLLPQDPVDQLVSLGIPLFESHSKNGGTGTQGWRFVQPCAAFDGCRCRIYPSRPSYCVQFECLVLKNLNSASLSKEEALRIILRAKRQAKKVDKLLGALGDTDRMLSIGERFHRTAKHVEQGEAEPKIAEIFGKLTVAFHELNVLLQTHFYPAAAP
jgi:Fe-S-cluster containining protein